MKPPHGNHLSNKKLHHLYYFWDTQNKEIFKYGISAGIINAHGFSLRMREQLEIFNLAAEADRYTVKILIKNIAGRKKAEEIEKKHIVDYEKKFGKKPRGNRKKIKHK